jgi:signal transduction histidine kinase
MAQVESGQIQLKLEAVAPADIITYAMNALRVQADQKRIHFETSIPTDLPTVKADPDKASWVLVNFLSNAVRHSSDEASIDIVAARQNGAVEFRVRDHGVGIRPEHRDRVFDRYFRAPAVQRSGSNRQASGTGLGLAISKEFIQSMNGEIGLDTSVSDGAAFWFRLPVG